MAIATESEQRHIKERSVRIEFRGAISLLQCEFVAASRVFRGPVGRYRMNVLWRHRRFGEHRFAGHPKIAFRMVVGDEALVAPVPRHLLPRETVPEFLRGQQSIKCLRRRSTRERNTERTMRR